ncbi:MAG: MauE/DoxX family redox-associated membrane protein [Bacteroidota bacterium]
MKRDQRWRQVIQWTARVVLAAVLLFAGILKLMDDSALFETVGYITWIPVWLKLQMITLLPWVEIVLALLLVTWRLDRWVRPLVIAVFFGFFLFSIYGTVTGMEGDCGCFGEMMDSTFGWKMITRNGFFLLLAISLYLPLQRSSPMD